MNAIILAAGEAKRMPNKVLLPIRDRQLMVESAIAFADRHCEATTLVVPPQSSIPQVLRDRDHVLDYVVQPKPNGVLEAIMWGFARSPQSDRYLILFGDNIYGEDMPSPSGDGNWGTAYVGDRNAELDSWNPRLSKWMTRGDESANTLFAGYIETSYEVMCRMSGESLIEWMNIEKFKAKRFRRTVWCDLGTRDSYMKYWT